ncbi:MULTISPECIES: outer membrane beta-barrel protein [unclassified Ketobacter]|uniref:outer membrane beta-barrel protein n=1 Tax=unclassified Ketobacter TaxID=2639109 RepID=UPI000F1B3B1B|nr:MULTISPECIES: outer membrane beta-barrel protein [unclassified Ketobacter]RLT88956.1 MAG: hypothetical protein D9N13_17545 [Ketobacter sp. GenoA1]RLT97095.1 MAG: hypothetical protein D9N15_08925 [Ketobacter sp.]
MKLNQLRAFGLGALLVFGFSTQVHAQGYSGVYAGIGLGYSQYTSIEDFFLEPGSEDNQNFDIDENAFAYQLFAGWEFVPRYLALEFSYIDFGESQTDYRYSETSGSNSIEYKDSFHFKTTAMGIALKGSLPLGSSLSLFGKAGIATWDVDGKVRFETYFNGVEDTALSFETEELDGEDFFYSIGAEYHYSENLSLYAEYLIQEEEHEFDGESYNYFEVSALSVGVIWRFDEPGPRSRKHSDNGKRNITACDEKYKDVSGIICQE